MSTAHDPAQSPLGKSTVYAEGYDAGLLFAIPRAPQRAGLDGWGQVPMHGLDLWNAYELSWLQPGGVPGVAVAEIRVPAESPCIVESKSLKLYLNGFAQTVVATPAQLAQTLETDLGAAAGAAVSVRLREPAALAGQSLAAWDGRSIDQLATQVASCDAPQPDLLQCASRRLVDECLVSDLLRSRCPVTGQPDWASVQIRYHGPEWDAASVLRYLLSYRTHAEFHEHCVERIHHDLWRRLGPDRLTVYARYTRRGGIDINPIRSSEPVQAVANPRLPRQ